jgi:hypothetical protein
MAGLVEENARKVERRLAFLSEERFARQMTARVGGESCARRTRLSSHERGRRGILRRR